MVFILSTVVRLQHKPIIEIFSEINLNVNLGSESMS